MIKQKYRGFCEQVEVISTCGYNRQNKQKMLKLEFRDVILILHCLI